jgi:hypothetical protein
MFGTRGFAELMEKVPLITLVDTAPELAAGIAALRATAMKDGLEAKRWRAAHDGTWDVRALTMVDALARATGQSTTMAAAAGGRR